MTHQELLAMFAYEPDTGMLRRINGGRKPYPWRAIGTGGRYLATTNSEGTFYLHSLVWFYHHGYLPKRIDHKDRNTRDCRIENLRECTSAQNQYNSKRKSNNRSGVKGVVFHPRCPLKPWQAKITVNKKVVSLGYYASIFDAAQAYRIAATKFAGEFALPDTNHHEGLI